MRHVHCDLDDLSEGTNNIEPVLHITLVIVGHIQDQEVFKIKFLVHIILRYCFAATVSASRE